jgi:cysteine desulfurase
MSLPIYLDYAATTPVDPRVLQKILEYLNVYGNSGSVHALGIQARDAIANAREKVANLLHADANEIIWTSGATEGNNLALKGSAELYQSKGKHIVTMKTEHPSVLNSCMALEKNGFHVTYLAPLSNGLLDLQELKDALRPDTILVSIMHVNNETGMIQDIKKIAEEAHARGILFHTDATQSVGKLPLDVRAIPADLISFTAHKIYGPKGIGALYIRRKPRVRLAAQLHGGGQEQGMRSGTLPTHQIIGMAEAIAIAQKEMLHDEMKLFSLRTQLLQGLKNYAVNGSIDKSFPGIVNLCFPGKIANFLMDKIPGLAFSAGSACLSKGGEPSYVLRAMGLSASHAQSSIRLSMGRMTTSAEIAFAISALNAG